MFFNNYYGSYKIISSAHERLLKTQFFRKKGNLSSEEKIMAPFFSYYRVWQTSKDSLYRSSRFFDHYWVCYKMKSLGPRRLLNSQVFGKKADFPVKKRFWPIFSHFIEHNKGQEIFLRDHRFCLTIILQVIKVYLWDLRGR